MSDTLKSLLSELQKRFCLNRHSTLSLLRHLPSYLILNGILGNRKSRGFDLYHPEKEYEAQRGLSEPTISWSSQLYRTPMETHHRNWSSSSQHRPLWSDRGGHTRRLPRTPAPGGNCPAGTWRKRWLERGPCGTQQTTLRGGPGSGSCWRQDTAPRRSAGMSSLAPARSIPGQVLSSLW